MPVVVTGAGGLLGRSTVAALRRAGFKVRALDRRWSGDERLAGRWTGDIRDEAFVRRACDGARAIVHLAGVLPPDTERRSSWAREINVGGTRNVLAAAAAKPRPPLVIFASSPTIYGPSHDRLARPSDPPRPSDGYTHHKVTCEHLVRGAGVPWSIVRVGVCIDPRRAGFDLRLLPTIRRIHPDNRLEWIHPDDVARALSRLAERQTAWSRVLNLGGGPSCQIRHRALLGAATDALGLPPIPERVLGRHEYYTHWLDTSASQALLEYQRHSFDDFRREMRHALTRWRRGLAPVALALRGIGRVL